MITEEKMSELENGKKVKRNRKKTIQNVAQRDKKMKIQKKKRHSGYREKV